MEMSTKQVQDLTFEILKLHRKTEYNFLDVVKALSMSY